MEIASKSSVTTEKFVGSIVGGIITTVFGVVFGIIRGIDSGIKRYAESKNTGNPVMLRILMWMMFISVIIFVLKVNDLKVEKKSDVAKTEITEQNADLQSLRMKDATTLLDAIQTIYGLEGGEEKK